MLRRIKPHTKKGKDKKERKNSHAIPKDTCLFSLSALKATEVKNVQGGGEKATTAGHFFP